MANARWAVIACLVILCLPRIPHAQEPTSRGIPMYRGPLAFQDPRDPFQAVRWMTGLYVPERLALEQAPFYSRRLEYRADDNLISIGYYAADWVIRAPVTYTNQEYAQMAFLDRLRLSMKETETNYGVLSNQQGLINVRLPFEVPFTEKLFGEGAPNLSVRGTHRIHVSGTSQWTVDAPTSQYGKQSVFPSLEMKQDLNVSLKGRIGTKLTLDIQQNSEALTPLENALKIRYTGEEDEVIQRVDLGNTSLSLPKTQNISFSTRQEGLFGVRADAQLGNVSMTAIASRQEGQQSGSSFSGSGEKITKAISDYSYEARRFFTLFNPDDYANSTQYPRINYASVEVLLDDNDQPNNVDQGAHFMTVVLPESPLPDAEADPHETGYFYLLQEPQDYDLQPLYENDPLYVLQLHNSLSEDQTLAVAYEETLSTGEVVQIGQSLKRSDIKDSLVVAMLSPAWDEWGSQYVTDSPWADIAGLEMKNIYYIGRGINSQTLDLSIWRIGTNEYDTQFYNGEQYTFINLLGLDLEENETGNDVPGGDGRVDKYRIDYARGLLFFPPTRPFDYFKLDEESGRSPEIYNREHAQLLKEQNKDFHKYEIRITYEKPLNEIAIGGFGGVLENSETVRLNGQVLERGTDYTVDWNAGIIELREIPPPNADIQVTWSEDSLLKQGATSLFGASIFNEGNRNYSWATSWLHQSEGLPEKRPRLGQESRKITLGDLSGRVSVRPWALTDLMDALPGVSTNVPSTVQVTGSLGLSFPNPNTKGAVWAADMEGSKLVSSAGLSNRNWFYTSIPEMPEYVPEGSDQPEPLILSAEGRGRLVWFSPATVDRGDLRPELDETERREPQSVLETVYVPTPVDVSSEYKWGGLVTALSRTGLDLSEAQYLEIWINDFIPYSRRNERRGEVRIDLGHVSEDAVWDPLLPPAAPNQKLDTEDEDTDGVVSTEEDIGLDQMENFEEMRTGDPNSTAGDPAFDDYQGIADESERVQVEDSVRRKVEKMRRINGTQGNTYLDTEDLDRNSALDTKNDYLSFTIDLADSADIDVTRDPGNLTRLTNADQNGWRVYRIPINDRTRQEIGNPNLNNVEHLRLWFRGVDKDLGGAPDTLDVQIAALSVVSNRWERQPILADGEPVDDADLEAQGAVYGVAVVNNKDDQEVYHPPFSLERRNRVTEREQSLSLEFDGFQPDHEFRATRFYPRVQDFTLYQDVRFYLNPRLEAPGDSLEFFVRFSSNTGRDSLDYYELATNVTYDDPRGDANGWMEFTVPITDLSGLKGAQAALADSFVVGPDHRPRVGGGLLATIRGTPSFSQVRIMTVGLRNRSGVVVHAGRVWIDDIRMGEVRRDVGWTGNVNVSLNMADVLSASARVAHTSEDFLRLNQDRGSGYATETIGFNTSLQAHKFVEDTGLNLPVQYSFNNTRRVPKFKANSDVEFTGENSGRDIDQQNQWDLSLSASRTGRGRSSWISRYTVNALRLDTNFSGSTNDNITRIDTSSAHSSTVTYNLSPGYRAYQMGRLQVSPFPKSINVRWNRSTSHKVAYTKDRFDPTVVQKTNDIRTLTEGLSMGSNFSFLRNLTFGVSSNRDLVDANWQQPLLLEERPATTVFGLSLGRETSRSYKWNYSINPGLLWFQPRVNVATGYQQATGARETGGDYDHVAKTIGNNTTVRLNFTVPLGRFLDSLRPKDGEDKKENSAKQAALREAERKQQELEALLRANAKKASTAQGEAVQDTTKQEGAADSKGDRKDDQDKNKEKQGGGLSILPLLRVVNPRDVQLQVTNGRTTNYSNIYGSASPMYQFGLTSKPGDGILGVNRVLDGGNKTSLRRSSISRDFVLNGNTGVTLMRRLSVDVKFSHSHSRADANASTDIRSDTTWPDLVFRWDRLKNGLPLLDQIFVDFNTVSTNYSRKVTKRGRVENPEESITESTSFNPLFSVNGTLRGGWQMSTQVNTSTSITKRPLANSELINKLFKVSTSFKKKFVRGPNKRSIDFDFNVSYGRNPKTSKGYKTQHSGLESIQVGTSARIKITDAIPGTFSLNFTQRKDLRTLRIDRSLSVNFSTQVSF